MQPDYTPIVQKLVDALPYFIGILVFIFALGYLDQRFGGRKRGWRGRRRGSWQSRRDTRRWFEPRHDPVGGRVPDAADQLRTVMHAEFKPQRLLNKSEARLFKAVDKQVLEARPGWQVMAQVSLGEILRCEDKDAYLCINSKRVDLLIVDEQCRPLHAIEYQAARLSRAPTIDARSLSRGTGEHGNAARDAVKKEALRRAGIGYVEVVGGEMSPAELRQVIEKLVQKAPA
jgi:hypothetical protein